MIYAFYSYKGGVGRSMALVNIAELMYRAGSKVLMVDWDLEAPGLERFYPSQVEHVLRSLGVIDMLLAYKDKATKFEPETVKSLFPLDNIQSYMIGMHSDVAGPGRLWLIPAGRRAEDTDVQRVHGTASEEAAQREYRAKLRKILASRFSEGELRNLCASLEIDSDDLPGEGKANKARELVLHLERLDRIPELVRVGKQRRSDIHWDDILRVTSKPPPQLHTSSSQELAGGLFFEYANRVKAFDWQDFYVNWAGEAYFEWLREQLDGVADVVLIDSRTGVTEMGGVCTYELADVVVMFCAANVQNMDGTLQIVKSFSDPRLPQLRHGRELTTLVVPARIEGLSETQALNRFRQQFARCFAPYMPRELQDPDSLVQLEIPYVPLYAFEEIIAVNQTRTLERAVEMEQAYTNLLRVLSSLGEKELIPELKKEQEPIPELRVQPVSVAEAICPHLLAKYGIERQLGEGGGGHVYLARDRELGRVVALKHRKVLTPDDQHRAERLLQEARTVANLRHPNVAVVYATESYPESGDYCVVMEYADGGTLADLLEAEGRLSLERALDIGIEICTALQHVHPSVLI